MLMKLNIREILRRLLKYAILVLVVAVTLYNIPEQKVANSEIFLISLLAGLTFCILDIITPSIYLSINKNEE